MDHRLVVCFQALLCKLVHFFDGCVGANKSRRFGAPQMTRFSPLILNSSSNISSPNRFSLAVFPLSITIPQYLVSQRHKSPRMHHKYGSFCFLKHNSASYIFCVNFKNETSLQMFPAVKLKFFVFCEVQ